MAITTIPWGDGSGDNIYLSAPSQTGDQSVSVTSDPNTGAARSKVVTFSASGVPSVTLTITQDGLPYTPLTYIQTDGTAYIDTGIAGTSPISSEVKVVIASVTDCVMLGKGQINTSSQVPSMLVPLFIRTGLACFGYRFRYVTGSPDISTYIANQAPFIARTRLKAGNQWIGVKVNQEDSWTSLSKTQGTAPTGTSNLYLFRTNYSSAPLPCPSGSRVYYCRIYSDYDLTTLVFDGIPCQYNGEYGLWDKVTNSFFGNAAGSGAFTGA